MQLAYAKSGICSWPSLTALFCFAASLAFLQRHQFNAIRFPFDHARMVSDEILVDSPKVSRAPELVHLPYSRVFLTLSRAAARRSMLVVLACDRLTTSTPPGAKESGLWYSDRLSEAEVARSWAHLASTLCDQWNVIGVDLLSQPFKATWASGDEATDWNSAAERLGVRARAHIYASATLHAPLTPCHACRHRASGLHAARAQV